MSFLPLTLEERVRLQHKCHIQDFLKGAVAAGKSSSQVAKDLHCGISNLRRIAKKYNISFHSEPQKKPLQVSAEFSAKAINTHNILSRAWRV